MLIFGDEKNAIILNCVFPQELESELGRAVKNSLLSAVYEPGRETDPDNLGDFNINISGSKLKFARFYTYWFIYTPDGLYPTQADDKTMLMIYQALHTEETGDLRQLARETMQSLAPQKEIEVQEEKSIVIDRMPGYEITAYMEDFLPKERKLLYLVMLSGADFYYIFLGTTTADFTENLHMLKNVCTSFRRNTISK